MDISDIQSRINHAASNNDIENASNALRTLIQELAEALDPFPNFMDITTIQALEIEPEEGVNPELGCVVVFPDGEIRELVLRLIPGSIDFGGTDQTEEMQEIEFSPNDYINYARSAALQLDKIHEERGNYTQ